MYRFVCLAFLLVFILIFFLASVTLLKFHRMLEDHSFSHTVCLSTGKQLVRHKSEFFPSSYTSWVWRPMSPFIFLWNTLYDKNWSSYSRLLIPNFQVLTDARSLTSKADRVTKKRAIEDDDEDDNADRKTERPGNIKSEGARKPEGTWQICATVHLCLNQSRLPTL
jgi:hypothetical protein